MKLLLLDQFSDLGGAQHGFLDLLPALRGRGWNALAGLPGAGELFRRVREAGVECRRIACGPYRSGRKSPADIARFLAGTPRLARQIRQMARGADLVYLNGPRLLPAAAMAGLRQPVVFHAHSFLFPGPVRTLAGLALRHMDAWVLGSCRFVTNPWRPFVRPERMPVIYNGVAGPERETRPSNSSRPRIGCIGRIAPEKGQLEFLDAAARIHRSVPEAAFVIYGDVLFGDEGARQYGERVREAATGLPVEFAGWTNNVYAALSTLDLLLVPSASHEATTRVILEAFSCGVPVVAMRSGGIPEVVDHGRNGYLADSVASLADFAVDFLNARPDLRRAAREAWQSRFRLDRYRREVAEMLQQAVHSIA